jgi:uncharacterized damage-inducible protein DinB
MSDDLFLIGPRAGYTPRIGILVSQLANARHYLRRAARGLSVAELDAPPGTASNTIGALLAHLDAAENMFQRITFEGRRFTTEEAARYGASFELAGGAMSSGRLLDDYLRDMEETRARTVDAMKGRDDDWLETPKTFMGKPANTFYYWFHFIQDEARHTGQIILIRKHLMPGAQPDFNPYTLAD